MCEVSVRWPCVLLVSEKEKRNLELDPRCLRLHHKAADTLDFLKDFLDILDLVVSSNYLPPLSLTIPRDGKRQG